MKKSGIDTAGIYTDVAQHYMMISADGERDDIGTVLFRLGDYSVILICFNKWTDLLTIQSIWLL